MATNKRRGTGRVTPPKSAAGKPAARSRPDRTAPPGQVGRRPSSPLALFAVGLAWVAAGVIVLLSLHASWRFVPALFAFGIGAFFIRGGSATVVRHERRRKE